MELLINVLAISPPDWAIPWAGIGAACAGAGSLLTGIAALRASRNQGVKNEEADTRDSPSD
jgi:hypothetical protein